MGLLRRHHRARLTAAEAAEFDALLRRALAGEDVDVEDQVRYLDYLGGLGRFAFHGSGDGNLTELSTERKSGDTRAFGRQEAVYATPDPHWAAFFALVNRENATSIRNASVALSAGGRTRWYRRDMVPKDPNLPASRPGWLYVLARDTFRAEPRFLGLLDTAHWVSQDPVKPLFSIRLEPDRYTLAQHIRSVPPG